MGVLRNRSLLDELFLKYLKKPLEATDIYTRNALRAGVYQIHFLTRIPDYAAIGETVEAVKRARGVSRGSFVNGVLRNVQREIKERSLVEIRESLPESVRYSLPFWIEEELRAYFPGERMVKVAKTLNRKPPLYVRVTGEGRSMEEWAPDPDKGNISIVPHPSFGEILELSGSPPLRNSIPFLAGDVTPQDVGSFLVSKAVASISLKEKGEAGLLLDTCAAPGVKTSHLKKSLSRWELHAFDVSPARLKEMKENFRRLGIRGVTIGRADFTESIPEGYENACDVVFVDAPCSGLGVMRRHPEVKWRIGKEDVARHSVRGRKILENALRCVKKNGICFYATCTITKEENQALVENVSGTMGCEVQPLGDLLFEMPESFFWKEYMVTPPDILDGDIFFMAMMRRRNS